MKTVAACNAGNCTVIETLQATNETYAVCGVPTRDQSATLIGVVASLGALALIMVIMRLVDRAISSITQLGWDDLLIGLSGVCSRYFVFPAQIHTDDPFFTAHVSRDERASRCSRESWVWNRHMGYEARQYHH